MHRNEACNTPEGSRSPEWTNIVLKDPVFNGDPGKLRIYANYPPSVHMPGYETHLFGDKVQELSHIRTEYDSLGGFVSPRYVQRSIVLSGSCSTGSVAAAPAAASVLSVVASACVGCDQKIPKHGARWGIKIRRKPPAEYDSSNSPLWIAPNNAVVSFRRLWACVCSLQGHGILVSGGMYLSRMPKRSRSTTNTIKQRFGFCVEAFQRERKSATTCFT